MVFNLLVYHKKLIKPNNISIKTQKVIVPKVTDSFCRLLMSTSFNRPEIDHLGDLMRLHMSMTDRVGRIGHQSHHMMCGADQAPRLPYIYTFRTKSIVTVTYIKFFQDACIILRMLIVGPKSRVNVRVSKAARLFAKQRGHILINKYHFAFSQVIFYTLWLQKRILHKTNVYRKRYYTYYRKIEILRIFTFKLARIQSFSRLIYTHNLCSF